MEAIDAVLSRKVDSSRQSECIRLSEMNSSCLADLLSSEICLHPGSIHRE